MYVWQQETSSAHPLPFGAKPFPVSGPVDSRTCAPTDIGTVEKRVLLSEISVKVRPLWVDNRIMANNDNCFCGYGTNFCDLCREREERAKEAEKASSPQDKVDDKENRKAG